MLVWLFWGFLKHRGDIMFVQNPKMFDGDRLEWLFDCHLINWLPLFLKHGQKHPNITRNSCFYSGLWCLFGQGILSEQEIIKNSKKKQSTSIWIIHAPPAIIPQTSVCWRKERVGLVWQVSSQCTLNVLARGHRGFGIAEEASLLLWPWSLCMLSRPEHAGPATWLKAEWQERTLDL